MSNEATVLAKFREEFDKLPEDQLVKFDDYDIKRIRNVDKYALSFIHFRHEVVEDAITFATEVLTWRRDNKINQMSVETVGMNYVQRGIFFVHGRDKEGHRIIALIGRHLTKETRDQYRSCLLFWLERLQRAEPGQHVTFILDSAKSSMSNVDLNFIRFIIDCFSTYFPDLLKRIVILDMPWILNAIWNIVKQWMTEEQRSKTMFCSRKELKKIIDSKELPQILGGEADWVWSYPPFPDDLPQTTDFANDDDIRSSVSELSTSVSTSEKPDNKENRVKEDSNNNNNKHNNTAEFHSEVHTKSLKITRSSPLSEQNGKHYGERCGTYTSCEETRKGDLKAKINIRRRHTTHVVVHKGPDRNSTMSEFDTSNISSSTALDTSVKTDEIKLRNMLMMSPVSELCFSAAVSPSTQNSRLQTFITLRSIHLDKVIAYKVKTTSPERFHVKPSVGAIEPGAVAHIRVNLCPGYENTGTRDRFLILYQEMEENSSQMDDTVITEFWKKNSEKTSRYEQKLRVKVDSEAIKSIEDRNKNVEEIVPKKEKQKTKSSVSFANNLTSFNESNTEKSPIDVGKLKHDITSLRNNMTKMERRVTVLQDRVKYMIIAQLVLFVIFFYYIFTLPGPEVVLTQNEDVS